MDRKRLNRIVCAILALAALFLVCARLWQNRKFKQSAQADMDAMLVQIMTCVENNDAEQADRLAYGPGQLREIFPLIANYWHARSDDPYESSSLTFESALFESRQSNVVIYCVYLVHSDGEDYQVIMNYRRDEDGAGIIALNASRIQELLDMGIIPRALGQPVAGKTFGQWCFTLLWVLCCLFSLYTIYCIIRKKPYLYGLWMLLSLVFFGVLIYRSTSEVQTTVRLGLFTESKWTRYQNGVECFQVCLPVGALSYWCFRLQRILRRNRARRKKKRKRSITLYDRVQAYLLRKKAAAPSGESKPSAERDADSKPQEDAASPQREESSSSHHRHDSSHRRHSSHRRRSSRHRDFEESTQPDSDSSAQKESAPSPQNEYIISPRGDLPPPSRRHSSSRRRKPSEAFQQEPMELPQKDAEAQSESLIPPLEITTTALSGAIYTPQKQSSSRRRRSRRHSSSSRHGDSAALSQQEVPESTPSEPIPSQQMEPAPLPEEEPASLPKAEPLPPLEVETAVLPLNGEVYKPRKHSSRHRHSSSRHRHSSSSQHTASEESSRQELDEAPRSDAAIPSESEPAPAVQPEHDPLPQPEPDPIPQPEPDLIPQPEATVSLLDGPVYKPRKHSSRHRHSSSSHHEHSSSQHDESSSHQERASSESRRHSSSSEQRHSSSSHHRDSSSSRHRDSSSSHHRDSSHRRHSSSHHRHSSSETNRDS